MPDLGILLFIPPIKTEPHREQAQLALRQQAQRAVSALLRRLYCFPSTPEYWNIVVSFHKKHRGAFLF